MTRQMLSDSREPCVYTGSMTDHSLLNNNGFHGCLFSHILRFVSRSNSWHTLRQWKYRLFTVSVCVAQERWWVQPNLSVKGEKKQNYVAYLYFFNALTAILSKSSGEVTVAVYLKIMSRGTCFALEEVSPGVKMAKSNSCYLMYICIISNQIRVRVTCYFYHVSR